MDIPKPPKGPVPPKKPLPGLPPPAPLAGHKPPVPPKPGMGIPSPAQPPASEEIVRRLDRIEEKSGDMRDSRRQLEEQLKHLEQKLHEEREKSLLSNLRSKEEAVLSSRVDSSLHEMQEKLERERRTQELERSYQRAQEQLAEMEERLRAERETWVRTLQEQTAGKDFREEEMEAVFAQKLSSLERIWQDEKNGLLARIRAVDEARAREQMAAQTEMEKAGIEHDRQKHDLERIYEARLRETEEKALGYRRERDAIAERIADEEQEFMTLKAQVALIHSQVKLEKDRLNQTWAETLREKEEEMNVLKERASSLEAEFRSSAKEEIGKAEQGHIIEREQIKSQMEEDRRRHGEAAAELRIEAAELKTKLQQYGEKILFLQAQRKASDTDQQRENDRLIGEMRKMQEIHARERGMWKKSLEGIEGKLQKQRQEWDARLNREKEETERFKSHMKELEIQRDKKAAECETVRNKYHDERDGWSQIASSKDDQTQELYEKINMLVHAAEQKDAALIAEKQRQVELLSQKDREISAAGDDRARELHKKIDMLTGVVERKDAALLAEKERQIELVNKKDAEIVRVKEKQAEALVNQRQEFERDSERHWLAIRDKEAELLRVRAEQTDVMARQRQQLQTEFQEILRRVEKENRDWASKLRVQYEESFAAKEKGLSSEIRAMQGRMEAEFEALEHEHRGEREVFEKSVAQREREMRFAAKADAEKEIQVELENLRENGHRQSRQIGALKKMHEEMTKELEVEKVKWYQEKEMLITRISQKEVEVRSEFEVEEEGYHHTIEQLRERVRAKDSQIAEIQRKEEQRTEDIVPREEYERCRIEMHGLRDELRQKDNQLSLMTEENLQSKGAAGSRATESYENGESGGQVTREYPVPRSLWKKIWYYLNRTVLVVSFKRITRKK